MFISGVPQINSFKFEKNKRKIVIQIEFHLEVLNQV